MEDPSLKERCERSFLKVLYHLKRPGQSIVIDTTTERIYLQKCLDRYDRKVYEYLMANPHPALSRICRLWEEEGKLFVLEEFIAGETLEERLEKGSLGSPQKRQVLEDVCGALICLHRADPPLIHRDIKASNIMVTEEGRGRLIDFDAAKLYKAGQKEDTVLLGTAGTAAPEQYGFAQSDARTDIYALGKLILKMFPEDPAYGRAAARAVMFSPKDRYRSVEELLRALPGGEKGKGPVRRIPLLGAVPGFRSGKTENMAAAICYYGWLIFLTLTLQVEDAKGPLGLWACRTALLLGGLSLVALFTDPAGLLSRLPFPGTSRPLFRLFIYGLAAFFILVFHLLVLNLVTGLLGQGR